MASTRRTALLVARAVNVAPAIGRMARLMPEILVEDALTVLAKPRIGGAVLGRLEKRRHVDPQHLALVVERHQQALSLRPHGVRIDVRASNHLAIPRCQVPGHQRGRHVHPRSRLHLLLLRRA